MKPNSSFFSVAIGCHQLNVNFYRTQGEHANFYTTDAILDFRRVFYLPNYCH